MAKPIIGHRTSEYLKILKEINEDLKWLLRTAEGMPFVLACSGTGALDAAVANVVKPGDTTINILGGKFCERLAKISAQYGAKTVEIPVPYGQVVSLEKLAEALDAHPEAKLVTFSENETSTGALHPAKEISELVHKKSSALVLADAVSNLAGDDIPQDDWKLDIVCSGSQKCLGLPPGLGIVSVLPSAWKVIEQRKPAPSYYFNLLIMRDKWLKEQDTAYTSAIPLVRALNVALKMIKEEGYEQRVQRHARLARMIRAGFQAMGFKLFADPEHLSNTVTALTYPTGIQDKPFRDSMKKHGVAISGSQFPEIPFARVASMANCDERDVLTTISVAALALKELKMPPKDLGAGISAAITEFQK